MVELASIEAKKQENMFKNMMQAHTELISDFIAKKEGCICRNKRENTGRCQKGSSSGGSREKHDSEHELEGEAEI